VSEVRRRNDEPMNKSRRLSVAARGRCCSSPGAISRNEARGPSRLQRAGREPAARAVTRTERRRPRKRSIAAFPAVCFSSRFKHRPQEDSARYVPSGGGLSRHGFYWIQWAEQEWFVEIRRGYPFQGWLKHDPAIRCFGATRQRGRIMDEKGELVTGPWMRAWKGCGAA